MLVVIPCCAEEEKIKIIIHVCGLLFTTVVETAGLIPCCAGKIFLIPCCAEEKNLKLLFMFVGCCSLLSWKLEA